MLIGSRVVVVEGSGLASGKIGTVISRDEIATDHRGIPKILGHYQPVDWNHEVAIQYDNGNLDTMYKNRLRYYNG